MENKITYELIAQANQSIKTIQIKRKDKETGKTIAKDYAEVNQRLKAYRMVYPKGIIKPIIINLENGICVIQAEIYDEEGKLLSVATAQENQKSSYINQTNYIENCETSAVGRALGFAGLFSLLVNLPPIAPAKSELSIREPNISFSSWIC